MSTKLERVAHVNALIKLIATHGRRFFYDPKSQRIARMYIDVRGHIYFVDDYSDKHIYTHETGFSSHWRGFSHGGTLRSLIERLREYIRDGVHIGRGWMAPSYTAADGNIWGYSEESAAELRAAAYKLPIFQPEQL